MVLGIKGVSDKAMSEKESKAASLANLGAEGNSN